MEDGSRRRLGAGRLLLVLGVAACASAPPADGGGTAPDSAPTAAYYTAEQAARGERVFSSVCSACHGRNEFRGPIFEITWMAEPVGALFQHISTAMPQDAPGSLTPDEYAAVVAYLLQANGRPAGERELPADTARLARMRW